MKLTPVHIRGKRKSPSSSSCCSSATPPPPSTSQRPSKMRRSIKDVKHTRALEPRVTLDRLPAEILESILLHSRSVALPRSSPVIGAKLSSRATLLRFFIWGFHDTWDQWFGVPFSSTFIGPKAREQVTGNMDLREAMYLPCDGDPELQTALLELPWVDIDFILRAQQTWADTYARDRWSEPFTETTHSLSPDRNLSSPSPSPSTAPTSDPSLPPSGYGVFDARRLFGHDYTLFTASQAIRLTPVRTAARRVHPNVRIPLSLVTGPWDAEKRQRLFWLVRGGINLESLAGPTRGLPWEYHLEFLRNAAVRAETPDAVAYQCLRRLCDFKSVPLDILGREREDLVKRLQWGGDEAGEEGAGVLESALADITFSLDYLSFSCETEIW